MRKVLRWSPHVVHEGRHRQLQIHHATGRNHPRVLHWLHVNHGYRVAAFARQLLMRLLPFS